jgi:hypothetical protein
MLLKTRRLWRQVETGDANRMEYRMGRESWVVCIGIFKVALGFLFLWFLFQLARESWLGMLRVGTKAQNRLVVDDFLLDCLVGGLVSLAALWNFCVGLWLAFPRGRVVIDRAKRELTKHYQLLAYIVDRTYDLRDVTSVSFGRDESTLRFLGFCSVCLHSGSRGKSRLLLVAPAIRKQGRALAQEIANFLAVPGPAG